MKKRQLSDTAKQNSKNAAVISNNTKTDVEPQRSEFVFGFVPVDNDTQNGKALASYYQPSRYNMTKEEMQQEYNKQRETAREIIRSIQDRGKYRQKM